MRRSAFCLLLALSVCMTIPGMFPSRACAFVGCWESPCGTVVLTPSFKCGYRTMGLNVNVPIAPGTAPVDPVLLGVDGLDVTVKSPAMFVTSGRLAAQLGCWYLYVAAETAARPRVTAKFNQHPMFQAVGLNTPVDMTGSTFTWWLLDGGTGIQVYDNVILFAGLKRDEVTASLTQPRLEGGAVPLPSSADNYLDGDLLARMWIPYLGVNFSGPRYSGSLAFSPISVSQLRLPWRHVDQGNQVWESASYSFDTPGLFLEGKFDCDMRFGRVFDVGVWLKGTWMRFCGRGGENLRQTLGVQPSTSEGAAAWSATLNRYDLSLGLTASMAF